MQESGEDLGQDEPSELDTATVDMSIDSHLQDLLEKAGLE